jgi:hypothetical protein
LIGLILSPFRSTPAFVSDDVTTITRLFPRLLHDSYLVYSIIIYRHTPTGAACSTTCLNLAHDNAFDMPFSIDPNTSKGTTPISPSPASSRSNLRSGLTNILPSSSKRQRSPDERSSLLGNGRESRAPQRNLTADLDDAQTEEGGGSLEVQGDRRKGDDADGSSFSTSIGGKYPL